MVNSVSFAASRGIYDRPNVDAPQANVRPTVAPVAPKKKNSAAKVILGTVAAVAVTAAALALGHKYKGAIKPVLQKIGNVSFMKWAKNPAKTALKGLDKAGEWVTGKSKFVADKAVEYGGKAVDYVKGLFHKA